MGVLAREGLLIVLLLSSCAARTNQFARFSQAGVAYSKAVTVLLDEAGEAAIDADSMVLAKTRSALSREERQEAILEHNRLLRERLALLGDLKRHARLLRDYFEALGALAESDAPSLSAATEGLAQAVQQLHPRIEKARVGSVLISSFVGPVTQIAVAHFKARALEAELKQRAPVIERELDLQQAALTAIAEQLHTDLQALRQQRESNEVVLPYLGEESLPSRWGQRRREILQAELPAASAEAAAQAVRQLKGSFVSLCEGRGSEAGLSQLIADLHGIASQAEKIEAQAEP
jgi:hypothetical protein